jgi:REP element-mobilizing transposase RayT
VLNKYEYRRRLPHYQPDSRIFFITFCTYQRQQLSERARSIVLEVCLRGNGSLFELLAVVVMPDHVHLALTPIITTNGPVCIARIMQAIKSTSAHRINRELGHQGTVWQQESFDRALRREERLDDKIDYMMENPVRAGIVRNPSDYRWLWRKTDYERPRLCAARER